MGIWAWATGQESLGDAANDVKNDIGSAYDTVKQTVSNIASNGLTYVERGYGEASYENKTAGDYIMGYQDSPERAQALANEQSGNTAEGGYYAPETTKEKIQRWRENRQPGIVDNVENAASDIFHQAVANPWDAITSVGAAGAKSAPELLSIVKNYATGAQQAFTEMALTQRGVDHVGIFDSATGRYEPKEGFSQADLDNAISQRDKAAKSFRQDVIYSAFPPAGIPEGVADALQEGGPAGAVRALWYGPASDIFRDPNLSKNLQEKPLATVSNMAMAGAQLLAPFGMAKGIARGNVPKIDVTRPEINPEIQAKIKQYRIENGLPERPMPEATSEAAATSEPETSAGGDQIITTAEQQLGKPYQLGGDGTDTTDCGKFTLDVFAQNGIELNTRRADLQYEGLESEGKTFDNPSQLQPGDLVFFKNTYDDNTGYKEITHVGIYAGDGKMLQAGSRGVGYTDLNSDYWQSKIAGYGRPLDGEKISLEKSPVTAEKEDADTTALSEEENQSGATPDNDTVGLERSESKPETIGENSRSEVPNVDTEKVDQFVDNALDNQSKFETMPLREVTPEEANTIQKLTHVNVDGFSHEISTNELRHAINEHGDAAKEAERGQLPITADDLKKIPEIINSYDSIKRGSPSGSHQSVIYEKRINGSVYYVEAVIPKKGVLRSKTMWKKSSAQIVPEKSSPPYTSESNGIRPTTPERSLTSSKTNISAEKGKVNGRQTLANEEPPAYMDRELTTRIGEQAALGTPKTANGNGKVTPVTRAEINKAVDDLVASRTGKIGNKNYAGVFKVDKDVIRSANFGDFDTIAHEVGHYLDKKLKVSGHDAELIAAADKVWGKNKLYKKYTPDQRRAEGIAEFSRQYLTAPAKAKQNFPGYYQDFTEALAKNDKLNKKVTDIGDKMQRWFNQSAEARGRGSVTFGNDKSTFETIKDTARNAAYKAYEAFFDDKSELSRLTDAIQKQIGHDLEFEKNPYKRARMAQTSALARAEMLVSDDNPGLVRDTLNKLYHGKLQYDVTMKDIFDGLDKKVLNEKYPDYLDKGNFKSWQQAYSTLLAARRQIELQALEPEYKGPLTKTDAAEIMKNAPKELQDLAQKFYQYNDNLLAIAQDGGLISQETLNTLRDKYSNYAPMMRDFDDEAAMTDSLSSGKKLGNVSNPLKKLTEEGSTRSVIDPIESTIKNTFILLDAVERNKVAQTFVDLEKNSGIGRFIEKVPGETADAKKSIFTVMVDGKKQAYQTTPEFYRAIMSMNQASSNMLISFLKPFAQALRVGATISPDFIVRNVLRDTLTAGIYSETGFKPVLDSAKGVYSLIKDKPLAYEFKASGAPLSAFVGLDRKSVGRLIDEMAGDNKWRKVNPWTYVKVAYDGLREVSEYAESGTRIREFERARQQGKSIDESGLLAKDSTLDFSRSGTLTRQINQVVPFFNAALQGGDRFVRALKDNPKRTIPLAMMYITLPSVVSWVMNHDKDWYKELSDDVKNGCWLFESNGTIIRIPKPFEPGIFFGSAIERALDKAYGEDPDAVKKWASYAAQGFAPNVIPTLVGPVLEWMTNYSFFTGKSVVGRKEQRLPDEYQFNDYTSEAAKKLGKTTGLSPEKIDNTINGYLGSAGKFFVGLGDTFIGDKKEMPAKTTAEMPGIRGLTYTEFKNPNSVNEFYEKLDEAEKNHAATGKKGVVPADLKKLRRVEQTMKDLQKANLDITSNKELTAEQKRQKIDANKSKILQLAKNVLGKN